MIDPPPSKRTRRGIAAISRSCNPIHCAKAFSCLASVLFNAAMQYGRAGLWPAGRCHAETILPAPVFQLNELMTTTDFQCDRIDSDVAALKSAISNKLLYAIGKDPASAQPRDWLQAAELAVRDRLVDRWFKT